MRKNAEVQALIPWRYTPFFTSTDAADAGRALQAKKRGFFTIGSPLSYFSYGFPNVDKLFSNKMHFHVNYSDIWIHALFRKLIETGMVETCHFEGERRQGLDYSFCKKKTRFWRQNLRSTDFLLLEFVCLSP